MYFSPIHLIMDKKSIIRWNCCGIRANYNEILILMSLFSPSVISLQESFLKQSDNISFRDFNLFSRICPDGQRASGGTSIMVKSSVPHSQFDLNTNLQAVAVNVTLSRKVTICSIYLPPSEVFSRNSIQFIGQFDRSVTTTVYVGWRLKWLQ